MFDLEIECSKHGRKGLHSISGRVSLWRARILSITTEEY